MSGVEFRTVKKKIKSVHDNFFTLGSKMMLLGLEIFFAILFSWTQFAIFRSSELTYKTDSRKFFMFREKQNFVRNKTCC